MEKSEAITVTNYIKKLFVNWDDNDEQIRWWSGVLSHYDKEDAMAAVSKAAEETSFSQPPRNTILKYCRQFKERNHRTPQKEQPDTPRPTVFIQCVESGDIKAGYFKGVGSVFKAHKEREAHELAYGGRWEVVQEATHKDMVRRKFTVQGRYDLVDMVTQFEDIDNHRELYAFFSNRQKYPPVVDKKSEPLKNTATIGQLLQDDIAPF